MTTINDKYQTIREWAEAYRASGLNVVPLYDFSKNPQTVEVNLGGAWIRGWKDLQSRHGSDMEWKRWFYEHEATGLGVITGAISGIVVVDVDSYKAGGMTFHLDSPLKARTARGGMHYYFKYVEPIKTTGLKEGVFIEIKSDGGFIVLPPSRVWIDEAHTKQNTYAWETAKAKLTNLPPLHASDLEKYTRSNTVYHDMHEMVGATLGTQHNNLRTIALKTFGRFPKAEWDLAEPIIHKLAQDFIPPHPESLVNKLISDCKDYILKNNTDKPYVSPRSITQVAALRLEEKELERNAPLTGWPDLDRIVKGFIPGHLYTMTGLSNIGKTAIATNFAVRVARQKHNVLYYALEPENTVVDYISSVRENKRFDDLTAKDITTEDSYISIYGKEEIGSLADLLVSIREAPVRYGLAIVDHIGYFIRKTEGFVQEQSNAIKELVGLAKEKRMAILIIAHMRKMNKEMKKGYIPRVDDIAGSGAFTQDSTEVFIISRKLDPDDPDGVKLSQEGSLYVMKTKAGPNGKVPLIFSKFSAYVATPELVAQSFREVKKIDLSLPEEALSQKTIIEPKEVLSEEPTIAPLPF